MACAIRSDFLASLYIKNSNSQSMNVQIQIFLSLLLISSAGLVSWLSFILFLTFAVVTKYQTEQTFRYLIVGI